MEHETESGSFRACSFSHGRFRLHDERQLSAGVLQINRPVSLPSWPNSAESLRPPGRMSYCSTLRFFWTHRNVDLGFEFSWGYILLHILSEQHG